MNVHNKTEIMFDENGKAYWGQRPTRKSERSGHYWQDEYTHDESPNPPLASQPLKTFPGTLERVEELKQRAARGEHLWHPDDPASFDGFKGDYRDISIFGNGPRKEQRKRGSSRIG